MVFNDDSQRKIDNIAEALKSNPTYSSYSIKSYCYDFKAGVHAIEITKNGDTINLFLFYPWFKGEIESIAIYGYNLMGHYNAIKSSMTIFGLPVDSVDLESGLERFIDVHLAIEIRYGLTEANYSTVQANVMKNASRYMVLMISFKSLIQREIMPMLSQQELSDIRDCRLNASTINKLATLGKKHFQSSSQKSNEVLYCICMAIGTIIKEYDWGTQYIQQSGMCAMSQKIVQ